MQYNKSRELKGKINHHTFQFLWKENTRIIVINVLILYWNQIILNIGTNKIILKICLPIQWNLTLFSIAYFIYIYNKKYNKNKVLSEFMVIFFISLLNIFFSSLRTISLSQFNLSNKSFCFKKKMMHRPRFVKNSLKNKDWQQYFIN